MNYTKKYLNFLFLTALSLQSFHVMGCELGYSGVEDTAEVSNAFSEMFRDSSTIALNTVRENPVVLVTALLGGSLFIAKNKISDFAEKHCKNLENKIEQECRDGAKKFEQSSVQNKTLLFALKPFALGLGDYYSHSKLHIAIAGIFASLGYVTGHHYIGGCFSSIPLVKAWFDRVKMELFKRFDVVDKAIADARAENAKLHAEAQEKLIGIDQEVKNISITLNATKKEILEEVQKVEGNVKGEIQNVGANLLALDGKLKDVPVQVLSLAEKLKDAQQTLIKLSKDNATIVSQNQEMIQTTNQMSQKLSEATDNFAQTKQEFDQLCSHVTQQIKESTKNMQAQISDVKTDMQAQFENLFQNVTTHNQLIESIQTIQNSNSKQLQGLLQQRDADSKLLSKIMESQATSVENYAIVVSSLDEIRKFHNQSINTVCTQIASINNKVDNIASKIENNEKKQAQNNELLLGKIKKLKKNRKESDEKILELFGAVNQLRIELDAANKKINKKIDTNTAIALETNSMARSFTAQSNVTPLQVASPSSIPFVQDENPFPDKRPSLPIPRIPGKRNGQKLLSQDINS